MFNIGFAELILILLIAFVVVGPKDLPKIARALGRFVRYIRNMVEEVKRESGLDEVESEFKKMERPRRGYPSGAAEDAAVNQQGAERDQKGRQLQGLQVKYGR